MPADPADQVIKRVTEMLAPRFTDLYRVYFDPAFPRADQTTFSVFQVVFAVGPGEDSEVRVSVHRRFEELLPLLAPMSEVRQSTLYLRARRHIPPHSEPDHPHMYIECGWRGADIAKMFKEGTLAHWHANSVFYINRFDQRDPLNKSA